MSKDNTLNIQTIERIVELRRQANEVLDSHQCQLSQEEAQTILELTDEIEQLRALIDMQHASQERRQARIEKLEADQRVLETQLKDLEAENRKLEGTLRELGTHCCCLILDENDEGHVESCPVLIVSKVLGNL